MTNPLFLLAIRAIRRSLARLRLPVRRTKDWLFVLVANVQHVLLHLTRFDRRPCSFRVLYSVHTFTLSSGTVCFRRARLSCSLRIA